MRQCQLLSGRRSTAAEFSFGVTATQLTLPDPWSNFQAIFVSRSERLHSDVLYFLGDASKAFNNHFSKELHKISENSTLGPSVIMFHETNFTNVLPPSDDNPRSGMKSPEAIIRDHLTSLDQVRSKY